MTSGRDKEGIMIALVERFEKQRLPRIMDIKAHVDQGGTLREDEMAFLEQVMEDAQHNVHQLEDIAECQHLFVKLVRLYEEIIGKAAENAGGQ